MKEANIERGRKEALKQARIGQVADSVYRAIVDGQEIITDLDGVFLDQTTIDCGPVPLSREALEILASLEKKHNVVLGVATDRPTKIISYLRGAFGFQFAGRVITEAGQRITIDGKDRIFSPMAPRVIRAFQEYIRTDDRFITERQLGFASDRWKRVKQSASSKVCTADSPWQGDNRYCLWFYENPFHYPNNQPAVKDIILPAVLEAARNCGAVYGQDVICTPPVSTGYDGLSFVTIQGLLFGQQIDKGLAFFITQLTHPKENILYIADGEPADVGMGRMVRSFGGTTIGIGNSRQVESSAFLQHAHVVLTHPDQLAQALKEAQKRLLLHKRLTGALQKASPDHFYTLQQPTGTALETYLQTPK